MRLRHHTPFYQHRTPKKNVTLIFITEPNNTGHALKKTEPNPQKKSEPNSHKFSKMTCFTGKMTIFRFFIDTGVLES